MSGFVLLKWRIVFRCFLLLMCCYGVYALEEPYLFVGLVGAILGMTAQDASWFHGMRHSWRFLEEVIDWAEVERIAEEDR